MNLHRTGVSPEWESVPPAKRNSWQRLAAATNGIVTPANALSFIGIALVIASAVLIYQEHFMWGFILLFIGRMADIADGIVAHYTKTKSPLGEMIDATFDKIAIIIILPILLVVDSIPLIALLLIALQSLLNALFGVYAHWRHRVIHPTLLGKVSGAMAWATLLLFVAVGAAEAAGQEGLATFTSVLAQCALLLFVLLGTIATVGYGAEAFRGKQSSR